MAVEKPAIIIPIMINAAVELSFVEKNTMTNKANKAPTKEAKQINQELFNQAEKPKIEDKKITTATPKPAAALIPKTEGSANGFRNNSCNNHPLIGKEIPAKIAAMALGKR